MGRKILAIIVSVFIFVFSVPQASFAELGSFFKDTNDAEISSSAAKAINLLDISNKIAKQYYGGTKDFFFNMYIQSSSNDQMPVYASKTGKIIIHASSVMISGGKKTILSGGEFSATSGFINDRMRGSPPGNTEITKLYLLSIEALHKGSVPASNFITNNILI